MEANAAVSNPAKQPLLILRSPPVVGPETTWKQARRMDALLRRTPQTLSLHGPHGQTACLIYERQPATRPNFFCKRRVTSFCSSILLGSYFSYSRISKKL